MAMLVGLQCRARELELQIKYLILKRDWRAVAEHANELRFLDSILSYRVKQAEDHLNDWPHLISPPHEG